jgi:peptidoglycan/LPS O-acetylase OafA/YrhL
MKQISEPNDARRHNNFDLLRLLFASIVLLYHCYDLSFSPEYFWIPRVASADLAVQGFFAMSGFLIVSSYESSSTLRSYLSNRGRRILPAYWAALIFTFHFADQCFFNLDLHMEICGCQFLFCQLSPPKPSGTVREKSGDVQRERLALDN